MEMKGVTFGGSKVDKIGCSQVCFLGNGRLVFGYVPWMGKKL